MNLNLENTPRIETERLILRKFTANDLDALFHIYADQQANTFLPWFPVKNPEEARILLEERYLKSYRESRGYRYAICLKQDDIPIGYVHVDMDESNDFGYGLRTEFWHQGIVTEACQAVILQLRKDHIPFITATHDVNNPRSGEVMKKLGMNYQYSYEEQWQPKDLPVIFRLYQLNLDGKDHGIYRKYWENSTVHFVELNL